MNKNRCLVMLLILCMSIIMCTGCGNSVEDIATLPSTQDTIHEKNDETSQSEQAQQKEQEQKEQEEQARRELEWNNALAKNSYASVVSSYIYHDWNRLNMEDQGNGTDAFGQDSNTFALADLNNDGIEEMIVSMTDTYSAGMREDIFYFDTSTKTAKRMDNTFFPAVNFYDNGVLTEDISHNQGIAGDAVWPYTLYRYEPDSNNYVAYASVDGWDKSYATTDYSGNKFPDEIDTNGDGYIFYINENGQMRTVDNAEYEEWVKQQYGSSNKITLSSEPLNEESFAKLGADYEKLLLERTAPLMENDNLDLGLEYAKVMCFSNNASCQEYRQILEKKLQMKQIDEMEEEYEGSVGGVKCVEYYQMDGGSVNLMAAVDGVTLFGIKPGDAVDSAVDKLAMYGLHPEGESDNRYISGYAYRDFGVYMNVENGIIKNISISYFCYYVG